MLEAATIYRVTLALKNKKSRTAVSLKDMIDDLVGAKDEFNALNGAGHRMLLLEPTRKRLNLLFKPGPAEQPFQQTMLQPFVDILNDSFDWQDYIENDNALFDIKMSQPVQRSEYKSLLKQLEQAGPAEHLGDAELEKLLGRRSSIDQSFMPRPFRSKDPEELPELSLAEAMQQLDELIGLHEFKAEIKKVVSYIEQLRASGGQIPARDAYPFHYLCTTEGPGLGLSSALNLMATIFYHLEICPFSGCLEEKVDQVRSFMRYNEFDENGICAAHGVNHLDDSDLKELLDKMTGEFQHQIIVMVIDADNRSDLARIEKEMCCLGIPFRKLHFKTYSEDELLAIFKKMIYSYSLPFSAEAEQKLLELIGQLKEKNRFCQTRTLKDLSCKMAFELAGPPADEKAVIRLLTDYLKAEPAAEDQKNKPPSPLTELENLVGLNTVKERVREILAHFALEKKKAALGIAGSNLCMHMLFTGNPGTGKTTVARIVGQVLKAEGLLKKGELIEVCREDLVGIYVGQTAPKTAAVIEKSLGSVLFIDEAYSLNGNHEYDYGREVLATLVKKMEEHKVELVVIMAGYSDEMEKMVSLNPGLKSRVPHQIHFPDYDATELYQIFKLQLGADYTLTDPAAEKLKELFATAASVCHMQSGNGRFIRNLVERLKMKQGKRLSALENPNQEELLQINLKDILALFEDRDITEVLGKKDSKLIGF